MVPTTSEAASAEASPWQALTGYSSRAYSGIPPQAHTSRKDGRRYATLNIATTRWVDAGTNSRWETEWHQAVVYDHLAEYASEKLFKGNGVYVRGYLKTVKATGRDGIDRYTVWVVGEELQPNATKTVAKQTDSGT